jgi:dTDP-4-dehydrorhamnose 3,5-epimerase-like enzyme
MLIKIINLKNCIDERGSLVAVEANKDISFDIKRVYYIYNNKTDLRRGFHSHKKLKQLLICVGGSCKIHLDDGITTEDVLLNDPSRGLVIESNIWREMYDFSKDAILLVLASEYYDESDYIRNYDEFIKFVKNQEK